MLQSNCANLDAGLKAVQDSPDNRSPERMCVRCPDDRSVLAAKGTTFMLVESPAVKPCHNSRAAR